MLLFVINFIINDAKHCVILSAQIALGSLVLGMSGLGCPGCGFVAAERLLDVSTCFFLWVGFVVPVQILRVVGLSLLPVFCGLKQQLF